jgi:general secretion pathway protein N
MPKTWSWAALGVGAYVAFTIAAFPAATAYRWFAPPLVQLGGIEGTIWSGRAAGGSVAQLALQDVRWRTRPLSLLLGRIAADVDARLQDGFVNSHVVATTRRVRLTDLKASTSLATLAGVLPIIKGARGVANAALGELEIENGWPSSIAGEVRLANLEVQPLAQSARGQRLVPIGSYRVELSTGADRGIAGKIADTGGPLEVTGTITADAARSYTLDVAVKPRADAAPELVQGLAFMTADPDAAGRRRLTLNGSL